MLDNFRNLSEKGKMIVVGIIIVVFVAVIVVVSSLIKTNETPEPLPTLDPAPSQSSAPAEVEETPSPSPSETAPAPSPSATINYGETTLSLEDQKEAQSVAKAATMEILKTDKGETKEAKNQRIAQYADPNSEIFTDVSLSEEVGLEKTDENNFIISVGSIDYIDPVGGTEQEYKVIAGSTLKIQYNKEGVAPQILEYNKTYVILLSKASGSWKVTSFIES